MLALAFPDTSFQHMITISELRHAHGCMVPHNGHELHEVIMWF